MAKYYYVVLLKGQEGREEEFQTWYDEQHLPDCVNVPGVMSARRFKLLHQVGAGAVAEPYDFTSLALYEMETDDPLAVAKYMSSLANTPAMPMTDAVDRGDAVKIVAVPMGEAVKPAAKAAE